MATLFGHIHLYSSDPEKTAQFYEKMFGAQRKYTQLIEGKARVAVEIQGVRIVFWQESESRRVSSELSVIDHLGFNTDDVTSLVANLKAIGCKIRDEITEVAPGTRVAYIWGPDHILLELVEAKPPQQT